MRTVIGIVFVGLVVAALVIALQATKIWNNRQRY